MKLKPDVSNFASSVIRSWQNVVSRNVVRRNVKNSGQHLGKSLRQRRLAVEEADGGVKLGNVGEKSGRDFDRKLKRSLEGIVERFRWRSTRCWKETEKNWLLKFFCLKRLVERVIIGTSKVQTLFWTIYFLLSLLPNISKIKYNYY